MPPPPHRPGVLAWQVFRGSDAIRQGLVTEHQLRSSAWLRLRHDVYADARLDRDHALACRAAALRLPPEAVVAGPSAAYLHGVEHAASFVDDVHVLVPRAMRLGPQRGLRVHSTGPHRQPAGAGGGPHPTLRTPAEGGGTAAPATAGWDPAVCAPAGGRDTAVPVPAGGGEVAVVPPGGGLRTALRAPADGRGIAVRPVPAGLRVADLRTAGVPVSTDPTSAAWETAVWLEPLRAVGIVDSLLRQGLTSRAALADVAARNADRPGGRRARWVFGLADPGARSPAESELRVRLVLAGLPRPAVRHPVRVAAGLVVHADLAWSAYRVAVAQDGRHAEADGGHLDRIARLVGAGWLVLPVTGRRLRHDFPGVLREARAALGARGWRP
ncbi:Transcriptional regulator, AbiEi antitoxin, Type IV TA system [Micromonospora echinofusca]|uniref:Transcriptional regulator, AbiEi antitoxin, Type IV TA system n=1 Tax=Micromonospora echinofusca TaxID=47858 RepID=A0A1C5GIX1_MICEH|nr:hypothetical protein [Micromonospora echinofusca]SCG19728.1 Transcriptional regulator, AbiEi antitoxin, Type IV TA system [Micromonospora echinofusca]